MREKLLLAALAVGLCSFAQAQAQKSTPPEQRQTPATQSQDKTTAGSTMTGCLQRGSGAGKYTITESDGKKYDIMTSDSSIKLDQHVGHRVTVKTGPESDPKRGESQTGELNVTSLTMISTSCQ